MSVIQKYDTISRVLLHYHLNSWIHDLSRLILCLFLPGLFVSLVVCGISGIGGLL